MRTFTIAVLMSSTVLVSGCATVTPPPASTGAIANPALWPAARSPAALTDPATEARLTALINRMTLRQKIGQLIQADISAIRPDDFTAYPLGSILAGGNSGPGGDERADAAAWARMVDAYRAASLRPASNRVAIPILFGVDAVHGHNNLPGATIFPHNIGLGAARDPGLIRRIAAATAAEVSASGIEWTFAPTLAVPQDARWGRTYEGYGDDPALIAAYAAAMVEGLQGPLSPGTTLAPGRVAATAKHFLADGGTARGQDQGDARIDEATLIGTHAVGYPPAINAGALTVMASFSSWNGVKHHGNASLLTGVLKDRMGFAGLVVGDWNGHGQIPGCTPTDCAAALLAGLDLYMAPDSWRGLFDSLLARAGAGEIPQERIDDAVRRILRVKAKLGLLDPAGPPTRARDGVIGAPQHLALAREAVSRSLVLLKNDGVLPLRAGTRVLITGPGADSMAMQSGGWTVSWQGTDVTKADFPNGQTIGAALKAAIEEAGGTATLDPMMSASARSGGAWDTVVVVYGEPPYAEFQGDLPHLDFQSAQGSGIASPAAARALGAKVVSVFLSGRPLFTGDEIAASDAFVAAWLPGTQGAGIADVLVAGRDGRARRDFTGTLPFAWPNGCEAGAPALFARGFGGTYARPPMSVRPATRCALAEQSGTDAVALYARGLTRGATASVDGTALPNLVGTTGPFTARGFDLKAQEDARALVWSGPARVTLGWAQPVRARGRTLSLRYRVPSRPVGPVSLTVSGAGTRSVDLRQTLETAAEKGWRNLSVPLACLTDGPTGDVVLAADGPLTLEIEEARIIPVTEAAVTPEACAGPF